jgi:hypothetical protein
LAWIFIHAIGELAGIGDGEQFGSPSFGRGELSKIATVQPIRAYGQVAGNGSVEAATGSQEGWLSMTTRGLLVSVERKPWGDAVAPVVADAPCRKLGRKRIGSRRGNRGREAVASNAPTGRTRN